jgi:hypothetical protein
VFSQPSTEKPVAEIAAPSAFTVHADCSRQSWCSGVVVLPVASAGSSMEISEMIAIRIFIDKTPIQ